MAEIFGVVATCNNIYGLTGIIALILGLIVVCATVVCIIELICSVFITYNEVHVAVKTKHQETDISLYDDVA